MRGAVTQKTRMGAAALAGLVCLAIPAAANAAESAYTKLDLEACEILKDYEEGGGFDAKCAGYKDVPVFVSEGDARMDVDYGVANDEFETFGPFSNIGETVEWRLDGGGNPFAAIIRFYLDQGVTGGPEDKAQVLVVSSVGTADGPGCVTAVVDAAVDQANGAARGAAAFALRHRCGTDAPIVIGPPDSFAFSMGGAVEEGQ